MKNTELLKLAETAAPFFPGGKAKFGLPAPSPRLQALTKPLLSPSARPVSIKPIEALAPYYTNSGGVSQAIQAAHDANKAHAPQRSDANPGVDLRRLLEPVQIKPDRYRSDFTYPDEIRMPLNAEGPAAQASNNVYAGFERSRRGSFFRNKSQAQYDESNTGFGTVPAPLPAPKFPMESLDSIKARQAASNHFKSPGIMNEVPATATLEHELGHAYLPGYKRFSQPETGEASGYYRRWPEQDQGLARTKRETAALTGQVISVPEEYDRLIQEINPKGQDEKAFEQRISPYSPEGQRYLRFLRLNKDKPEYYQEALQRGRTRMPLMVQSQILPSTDKVAARFHPHDLISEHKLTTGAHHGHRALLAASRLRKMKTPGKRPSKVENVEKSAFDFSTLVKAELARKAEKRLLRKKTEEEGEQEKQATWLERWLSMYAARDAAHQADPRKDALGTKLLGGPLSMGLGEAINNHAIMGTTPEARSEAMHEAAADVKEESYGDSVIRGLKSSPAYIGLGAAAGAGYPAIQAKLQGRPIDAGKFLAGAGIGAAGGLGLAVLRPILQRAILGNVSRRSLNRAIQTKSEHPVLTALPLGDVIGATR